LPIGRFGKSKSLGGNRVILGVLRLQRLTPMPVDSHARPMPNLDRRAALWRLLKLRPLALAAATDSIQPD